jgi:hypothetical protein
MTYSPISFCSHMLPVHHVLKKPSEAFTVLITACRALIKVS